MFQQVICQTSELLNSLQPLLGRDFFSAALKLVVARGRGVVLMSGSEPPAPGERMVGRGGRCGRPNRLELLRREALEDARAEATSDAPEAPHPAAAALGIVPAPQGPYREMLAVGSVTKDMVVAFREPLPAQLTRPFAAIGCRLCGYSGRAHV